MPCDGHRLSYSQVQRGARELGPTFVGSSLSRILRFAPEFVTMCLEGKLRARCSRSRIHRLPYLLSHSKCSRMNPNKALWEKGDFTLIAATMRDSGEAT